jgi:nucleolin
MAHKQKQRKTSKVGNKDKQAGKQKEKASVASSKKSKHEINAESLRQEMSSADDSSSDEEDATSVKPSVTEPTASKEMESLDSSSDEGIEEETVPMEDKKSPVMAMKEDKKNKVSVTPNAERKVKTPSTVPKIKKKTKKMAARSAEPFRRVKSEGIPVDPRLKDNSFMAKGGARGSWGEKAFYDFKTAKGKPLTKATNHTHTPLNYPFLYLGKNFRHEKTKKKRGSYRGGSIDTGVHSIKFED